MSRVAVATSTNAEDPDAPRLFAALARAGVSVDLVAWDAPANWDSYDLVVVRSTWDYVARRDEFLDWARRVRRLANPYPVLEYSSDKHYLGDLAARGHRIVPSTFCDVGDAPRWPDGDVVVKPTVGAGSADAARYREDEREAAAAHVARLHDAGRDALIQPYVASVDERGERAVVVIDGTFSHAMTKDAMLNVDAATRTTDFRRRQLRRAEVEPDALEAAIALLDDERFADLLYARVDLVSTEAGWALLELELVEPMLFLTYDETAADRLVAGIARRARD